MNPNVTAQYRCWTEDFPENPVWEGPVVRPGDSVYVDLTYPGANVVTYYIEDVTTGEAQAFTNAAPYVQLTSADFVNEAPGIPLGFTLPNFGSVAVSGNSLVVESNSGYTYTTYQLASSNNNVYELYDETTGHILSSPSTVASNGDFSQVFHYSS